MGEQEDRRVLFAFRRSGYAAPMRNILERRLQEMRNDALDNPVTERAMGAIDGIKQLMEEMFGEISGQSR